MWGARGIWFFVPPASFTCPANSGSWARLRALRFCAPRPLRPWRWAVSFSMRLQQIRPNRRRAPCRRWRQPSAVTQLSAICGRLLPFRRCGGAVPQWVSLFGNTATYGNYVALLGKCSFFPRPSPSWLTPRLRDASRMGWGNVRTEASASPTLFEARCW